MGFIEETGAAQFYRDARILTIYEGTTAIQANDLVGRKTARDGGATANAIVTRVNETAVAMRATNAEDLQAIAVHLSTASDALAEVVAYVVEHIGSDIKGVFAGSVPYLKMAGIVLGGWQMGRAALVAHQKQREGDAGFLQAKIVTARFFAEHFLPQAVAYRSAIIDGSRGVLALTEEQF